MEIGGLTDINTISRASQLLGEKGASVNIRWWKWWGMAFHA